MWRFDLVGRCASRFICGMSFVSKCKLNSVTARCANSARLVSWKMKRYAMPDSRSESKIVSRGMGIVNAGPIRLDICCLVLMTFLMKDVVGTGFICIT